MDAGAGGLENEPGLFFEAAIHDDLAGEIAHQFLQARLMAIAVKNTAVEIESDARDVKAAAAILAIEKEGRAVDIVDAAIGRPGRGEDVVVVLNCVGLERPAAGVRA